MANRKGCKEKMTRTRPCVGDRDCSRNNNNANNDADNNNDNDKDNDDDETGSIENKDGEDDEDERRLQKDRECQTTEWTDESCSCQDGQPKKKISREFRFPRNRKKCMLRHPNAQLEKYEDCPDTNCDGDGSATTRPVSASELKLF